MGLLQEIRNDRGDQGREAIAAEITGPSIPDLSRAQSRAVAVWTSSQRKHVESRSNSRPNSALGHALPAHRVRVKAICLAPAPVRAIGALGEAGRTMTAEMPIRGRRRAPREDRLREISRIADSEARGTARGPAALTGPCLSTALAALTCARSLERLLAMPLTLSGLRPGGTARCWRKSRRSSSPSPRRCPNHRQLLLGRC